MDPTIEERAALAMAALESQEKYRDAWPEGLDSSIVDLVTDLLHLARENDIEPDYVIHTAQMHFDAEMQDGQDGGVQDGYLSHHLGPGPASPANHLAGRVILPSP